MANKIQIKRSTTADTPGTVLDAGELAYSYTSNKLFMGSSGGVGNDPRILFGGNTGDINFVGITAGAGLSGSVVTTSGDHEQTLRIDPDAVIHVAGISSDAGATFGGNIYLPIQYAAIGPAGGQIQFNEPGNQIVLHEETVDILQTLRHYADPDTYLKYTTDDVTLQAGGNEFLHGTSTYAEFGGVTFADGGATFGGGINVGGDITVGGSVSGMSAFDLDDVYSPLVGPQQNDLLLYNVIAERFESTAAAASVVTSFNGSYGAIAGVNSWNGLTGAVGVTNSTTLIGGVTLGGGGATFGGNIVLQNNDYISNPSAYTVRMMPEGTSATDYGLEFEFSDWGYGSVITNRRASDGANAGSIKFDSSVVINTDTDLNFGSNAHSRMRWTSTGNNTLQIGVKSSDTVDDCSGAVAIINSSHFGIAARSPGVTHDNPNLYVYSYNTDATKYIRFEHDGTNANIVTGAGDISLQPASGVVGVSGDIKFGGNYHIRNSSGNSLFDAEGGTNVYIGDSESAGNDTLIHIRDSHTQIKMEAGTKIDLDSPAVYIPDALIHTGDTNTKLTFGTDSITLAAGGTDYQAITSAGTNFADTDVVKPKLKDYSETVNVITWENPTDIDFEDGNVQTLTVALAGQTVQFSNPPATGSAGTVTLIITNGGSQTITWPAAVKWPGDNAPALTSSGVDILSFTTIDAGTTIYGFVGGINFS